MLATHSNFSISAFAPVCLASGRPSGRGTPLAAAAPCHQRHLIPPAQNMAQEFVPLVKADGVGALQPSHAAHQVGVGRFQHQMVMIAQQTIRVNLPIGFLAGLGQRFQEILPGHVIQEYILPSVTPAQDRIYRPPIFDA